MNICPLLWRPSEALESGLLEKNVDLDERSPAAAAPAGGAGPSCLGAVCRFWREGDCLLERIGALVTREEIAEGLHLATAALTDEVRTALDCTAGPLRGLETQVTELAAAAATPDTSVRDALAQAETALQGQLDGWHEGFEERLTRWDLQLKDWRAGIGTQLAELTAQVADWRSGAAAQLTDLAGSLAQTTTEVGVQLRDLRVELSAESAARGEAEAAAQAWRDGLEKQMADTEERWENMVLSLTELTERLESALGVIHQHIAMESEERERSAKEARLAAAKRENNGGVAFYHSGDLEKARARFREAIALAPDFVEAYNNLGLVETELGHAEEATRHFQKAIELDPSLSASYNNLGYVFFLQENFEEAIAMYQEAIERAANGSAAWTNLGNAYFKLGNGEKAREAWETAVELDPGNRKAAENLARLLQGAPA